jgi:hypothetical protein
LFIIRNIERTDHTKDEASNPDSYVDWWGKGHAAETSSDSAFVPIFKSELPSIEYGALSIDAFGFTRIMILNNDTLYGPFDITVLEDQSLRAVASTMALSLPSENIMKVPFSITNNTNVIIKPPLEYLLPIQGFITSLSDFKREFRGSWETMDYIGNDRLIRYISGLQKTGTRKTLMTKRDVGEIAQEIRKFLDSKQGKQADPVRLERAIKLIQA